MHMFRSFGVAAAIVVATASLSPAMAVPAPERPGSIQPVADTMSAAYVGGFHGGFGGPALGFHPAVHPFASTHPDGFRVKPAFVFPCPAGTSYPTCTAPLG